MPVRRRVDLHRVSVLILALMETHRLGRWRMSRLHPIGMEDWIKSLFPIVLKHPVKFSTMRVYSHISPSIVVWPISDRIPSREWLTHKTTPVSPGSRVDWIMHFDSMRQFPIFKRVDFGHWVKMFLSPLGCGWIRLFQVEHSFIFRHPRQGPVLGVYPWLDSLPMDRLPYRCGEDSLFQSLDPFFRLAIGLILSSHGVRPMV